MFSEPPKSWEELQLWRVYCVTKPDNIWDIVQIWIKRNGNPYIIPDNESEQAYEERHMFQRTLEVAMKKVGT